MMFPVPPPSLLAVAEIRHRLTSRLVEGFDEWWQMPALVLAILAVMSLVVWLYRRDAAELHPVAAAGLAGLRLAAFAAVTLALLDFERIAEHEIVLPSRVAVLVDSSASMSLTDSGDTPRAEEARTVLDRGGLLDALAMRHEVSVWRFDADAETLARIPRRTVDASDGTPPVPAWQERAAPRGYETRLGEAIERVLDAEPDGVLAGVVVLTDGGNNAGVDPRSAAARAAAAGIPVHAIGIGADVPPANVRIADLLSPARVFPGDRFAVTAFLQAQGLASTPVRVELVESAPDRGPPSADARVIDTVEARLASDGELVPVRFDVPGLAGAGRRSLAVRVVPPPADHTPADDVQATDVEVVDRVTQVLLMAGGPSREYQFMRNVLKRDRSFAVDVILGTAAPGVSQDARRILDAFPASDEALAEYDAVVALDYDWRLLEPAAQARLDRWVAGESGGLVFVAGNVFMDAWLSDPRTTTIRGLFPVDLRRPGQVTGGDAAGGSGGGSLPRPLEFTRDGLDAEFLWLAGSRAASEAVWREFPGVHACFPSDGTKPGATVYARVAARAGSGAPAGDVYVAGQFYGSGLVLSFGSGELWRLRAIADGVYERLVAQIVRHVSQGRLLRGGRRGRLIVDRDRFPVGGTVTVRVVATDPAAVPRTGGCRAVAPDGTRLPVELAADPARRGTLQGSFVASREGAWEIEVEPVASGDERLTRRIQVQLPDRELAKPKLDRGLLVQLADVSGGRVRFLADGPLSPDEVGALAEAIPDRSRREYETGAADTVFKERLNTVLLAAGCGLLCVEWIARRLARLA
jgi:hypothetical protein